MYFWVLYNIIFLNIIIENEDESLKFILLRIFYRCVQYNLYVKIILSSHSNTYTNNNNNKKNYYKLILSTEISFVNIYD